jgi:hypothetical protein
MICKGKRLVVVLILWLVAAMLAGALLTASGHCETLRFVFMADCRGDSLHDLINTTVLNAINSQILGLSPRPAFVVFGGDQAYRGHSGGEYNFKKFKDALKSLTDAGIKLYMVMGNHELYREGTSGFVLGNQQEFQNEFTDNPVNGPPGYEKLVYSFESPGGDAFFAILDCYYLTQDDPSPDDHGHVDDIQRTWLVNQLTQTRATHKFLFMHPPYYLVTESQSTQNTSLTKMWRILDNNRFDIYFCGHDHLYSRKAIDSSIAPNPQLDPPIQWKNRVTQLLNGTCGAPVDTATPTVDRSAWHVFNADSTYYFSVVDINGSNVKVTSYGGKASPYQAIDYFTISRGINPGIDLMLLD